MPRKRRPPEHSTPRSSRTSKNRKQSKAALIRDHSVSAQSLRQDVAWPDVDAVVVDSKEPIHADSRAPVGYMQTRTDHSQQSRGRAATDDQTIPPKIHEYFYLSPSGEVEHRLRPQAPEHVNRSSDEPGLFYAPMQTPKLQPGQPMIRAAESSVSRTGT